MAKAQTIEIELDVHKRIEAGRQSFQETPNDILRRLLGIGEPEQLVIASKGRPWSGKGVTLQHGTNLRMEYNGRRHTGVIENGEWVVEGKRFRSPSAAAGGAALTRSGKHPSLDGWIYWQVKRPGDQSWITIRELRTQAA